MRSAKILRALGTLISARGSGSAAPARSRCISASASVLPHAHAGSGPCGARRPSGAAPLVPHARHIPSGAAGGALLRSLRRMGGGADGAAPGAAAGRVVSFPLAQTGEGISECELVEWHVKEGDAVEEFQPVCEVQSDKASIEITSRYAGVISRLHHAKGDMVKVGAALLDILLPEGAAPADAADAAGAAPSAAAAAPAGAAPAAAAGAAVLASPAVRALARELGVDPAGVAGSGPGGRLLKEDVFAASEAGGGGGGATAAVAAGGPAGAAVILSGLAAPSGGGLDDEARSLGAAAAATALAAAEDAAAGAAAAHAPPPTRVPLRGYRRAMVKSALEAAAVPTFHYFDDMELDELLRVRGHLREAAAQLLGGARLTYLPFVVKALSAALAAHPGLNCQVASGGGELLQMHGHNIGVAMATGGGLVVPNVKAVESKTIPEIARELARLQQLAASGKLQAPDLAGGSITISNIGTIGGTHATPMLNTPEAAIIALGRVRPLPRYDAATGALVRRHVMGFSFGADHRVVDGAAVAAFSNDFKRLLEEPSYLLMHLR
ncbi:MAG: lipoamide acyltransferase [Monoraphidium minutum]|nr:MAG: lipoamide acyltransferase [Monoraphidium minutum]